MARYRLEPFDLESTFAPDRPTLGNLPQWYAVGGHCSSCEREGWVDRDHLTRRYGKDARFMTLRPFLRCLACGNKGSNTWIMAKLPR